MASGFVAMGLLRGNSAFASKIDALIATADQFDRGEGPRAVASSAVVVRWYIDSLVAVAMPSTRARVRCGH
jgi:hypothetical protein